MVGKRIALRSNFSPMAPYELVLDVRDEAFDPCIRPTQLAAEREMSERPIVRFAVEEDLVVSG